MIDHKRIAKALYANRDEIMSAIDKYVAKADDDLAKQLKKEGYADPKGTVDTINDFQEEVAGILEDQTKDFIDALQEAEASGKDTEQLNRIVEDFTSSDTTGDDIADIATSMFEEITPQLASSYIQETEGDMVVTSLRQRTVSWFQSWGETLGSLMRISTHDQLSNLIQDTVSNGAGIADLTRKIMEGGWRDEYYQAKRVALTEVLRAHSVAREEAIQQSPASDQKEWKHTGAYKNNPRGNHVAMDGQIVPKSEAFELQGRDGATYRPMYPRDPLLPACESVNCHCIHRGIVNKDILGMSYEERKKLQQEIIDNDDGEWEKELDASNRAKAGIDISSEHESSKVKYDYASTVIDKKSIASATYRKKYSTLPETRKVQRKVASEARTMLRHRSGSKYEDLAFINSSTGETLTQTNCKTAGKVSPTRNMKKMIKNADENTIIGIHNHPTSSVPSIDDLEAAVQMKYKYGIVACHDGTVYKYNVVGELNSPKADGGLDKLQRAKYIEDEAERAAAVKKAVTILKDSGVEMEVL